MRWMWQGGCEIFPVISPVERKFWPVVRFYCWAIVLTLPLAVGAYILAAFAGAWLVMAFVTTKYDFRPIFFNLLYDKLRLNGDIGWLAHILPDKAFMASVAGGLLLAAFLAYRDPPIRWLTNAPRFRWRPLVWGMVMYGLIFAGGLVVQGALSEGGYQPSLAWLKGRPGNVLLFLLLLPIVSLAGAAGEEVIRGWWMRQSRALLPSLPIAILVSAILFALMHGSLDPFRLLQLSTFGVVLAWVAIRTGGLEWGIGLHTGWNLAVYLVSDRKEVAAPRGADPETVAAHIPTIMPTEWAVITAAALLIPILTELVLRTPSLRRLIGLSSSAAAAPVPSA